VCRRASYQIWEAGQEGPQEGGDAGCCLPAALLFRPHSHHHAYALLLSQRPPACLLFWQVLLPIDKQDRQGWQKISAMKPLAAIFKWRHTSLAALVGMKEKPRDISDGHIA